MDVLEGYIQTGTIRGAADRAGMSKSAAGNLLAGTKPCLPGLRIELELVKLARQSQQQVERDRDWTRVAMENAEMSAQRSDECLKENRATTEALNADLARLRAALPKVAKQRERLEAHIEAMYRHLADQQRREDELAAELRISRELNETLLALLQQLVPNLHELTSAAKDLSGWMAQRLGAENHPKVILLKAKADAVIETVRGLLPVLPRFVTGEAEVEPKT